MSVLAPPPSLLPSLSPSAPPTPKRSRIRFAPLPDPRRAVLLTEDGSELPLAPWATDGDLHPDYVHDQAPPNGILNPLTPVSIPAAVSIAALSPSGSPRVSLLNDLTPQSTPPRVHRSLPPHLDGLSSSTSSNSSNSSSNSSVSSEFQSRCSSLHTLTPTQSIDQQLSSPAGSILSHGTETPTQPQRPDNYGNHHHQPLKTRIFNNISTDQFLTLGAINLFRSSSRHSPSHVAKGRESTAPPSSWGHQLERYTSSSSFSSTKGEGKGSGLPMERTQSTQSYKGGNVRSKGLSSLNPFSGSGGNKPKRPTSSPSLNGRESGMIGTLHTGSRTPATKMLNGRVYGGKRQRPVSAGAPANPFANAKDEANPEFIEWGYGGMGSVRSVGVGGSVWGKVQSSQGFAGTETDENDGSGMGWVRKRREQREKEQREREEKEKAEQDKAIEEPTAVDATKTTDEAVTAPVEAQVMPEDSTSPASAPQPPTPQPFTKRHSHSASVGSTATVLSPSSILSPSPHALLSPSASDPLPTGQALSPSLSSSGAPTPTMRSTPTRTSSLGPGIPGLASGSLTSPGSPLGEDEHHVLTAVKIPMRPQYHAKSPSQHHVDIGTPVEKPASQEFPSSELSESSESSESSEEDDGEDDREKDKDEEDDDDDDEEDEDDEQGEQRRKTSLGAEMEKISRHKS